MPLRRGVGCGRLEPRGIRAPIPRLHQVRRLGGSGARTGVRTGSEPGPAWNIVSRFRCRVKRVADGRDPAGDHTDARAMPIPSRTPSGITSPPTPSTRRPPTWPIAATIASISVIDQLVRSLPSPAATSRTVSIASPGARARGPQTCAGSLYLRSSVLSPVKGWSRNQTLPESADDQPADQLHHLVGHDLTLLEGARESLNNPMFAVSRGRGGLDVKLDDIADRPGAALVTGYSANGRYPRRSASFPAVPPAAGRLLPCHPVA